MIDLHRGLIEICCFQCEFRAEAEEILEHRTSIMVDSELRLSTLKIYL